MTGVAIGMTDFRPIAMGQFCLRTFDLQDLHWFSLLLVSMIWRLFPFVLVSIHRELVPLGRKNPLVQFLTIQCTDLTSSKAQLFDLNGKS